MNVVDAIKSGKRFRFVGPDGPAHWFDFSGDRDSIFIELPIEWITSDQWEIEEKTATEGDE